ncbi:MAG: hypothetical protein H0T73_14220, partial [Ardenticatenales bacterium]|nr:hypothetical protein [Ardenticatenales bacterium]
EELRARVKTITRLNRYRRLLSERVRFSWVVEPATEGYVLVNEQDEIIYTNLQARLFLGLQNDQPIVEPFLSLIGHHYRCEPGELWEGWPQQDALTLGRPRYLVRPESATAKAFWLQVDVLNPPSEEEDSYLLRLRDITNQMSNQRDLRKFHAVIQHKFRSPLVHMISSIEILVQEGGALTDEEIVLLSRTALAGAHRLNSEIEDVLRYLRAPTLAQAGGGMALSGFRLVVEQIAANLELESVDMRVEPEASQARLRLSQEAVEWLLWELLENAKKFHPTHSPHIEIFLSPAEEGGVKLQIRDDGVRLAPEQLAQVWTPYYQGEKYFTGQVEGMGLGLPLVASMIWEVDGQCHLYNREDGGGVVVELVLPVA